jgi:hypothetical protein
MPSTRQLFAKITTQFAPLTSKARTPTFLSKDRAIPRLALESITWTEGPFCEQSGDENDNKTGAMAWIAGILVLRIAVKGKVFEQTFRATFVMRKNAKGAWQIRQEHVSAPLPDPYGIGDWLNKN